eukprot:scaffold125190_cov30-Tisochrysis_lutea.AAC.1
MSDEDDEPVEPLRRQSTGMLLALPAEETEANDEKDGASGHCADLLLVLDDGNEWSTSVDVSYTIEFVKALAREHFAELKEAPALWTAHCEATRDVRKCIFGTALALPLVLTGLPWKATDDAILLTHLMSHIAPRTYESSFEVEKLRGRMRADQAKMA